MAQIQCRLDDLLAGRELTLVQLSERIGISTVNLSVLKNNHAKAIRFSTLEAICKELNCTVGELFEYR
jgi:putative transcriptional regulator